MHSRRSAFSSGSQADIKPVDDLKGLHAQLLQQARQEARVEAAEGEGGHEAGLHHGVDASHNHCFSRSPSQKLRSAAAAAAGLCAPRPGPASSDQPGAKSARERLALRAARHGAAQPGPAP